MINTLPTIQGLISIIESGSFVLFQQRQFDLSLQKSIGTEVLLRLPDPADHENYSSTSLWINFAERHNLIKDLTLKIFHKILSHLPGLDASFAPYYINVPPTLITPHFIEQLKEMLGTYKIDPSLIGIELTERQPIPHTPIFQKCIEELRNLKIPLALDDYGRGFATMDFLHDLPLDRIKIDKDLLKTAQVSPHKYSILKTLLDFAAPFNLEIIAEGIETQPDLDFACQLKCTGVQGYYCDKPHSLIPLEKNVYTASSEIHSLHYF